MVRTRPTASLVHRAGRVHDTIAALPEGPIHLIGHSTGGLDARVLCTPSVDLVDRNAEPVAERVRTVITVSTPHRGTGLASVFQGVRGRRLLRSLSMATLVTLGTGERPVRAVVKLAGLIQGVADRTVGTPSLVDEVFDSLLDTFDEERKAAVRQFFADVGEDTSLVTQLSPEATHPLRALAPDRPGVRYASVITRAPAPTVLDAVKQGPRLRRQASLGLFAALYGVTGKSDVPFDGSVEEALRIAYGETIAENENDGIVPTRSQPWGEILAGVDADHLDILGHFDGRDAHPPHYDWVPSGAGFDREKFEAVWQRVFRVCVGEEAREPPADGDVEDD